MSKDTNTVSPEDFRKLTELHDMASHACELLKAMANEWRLMILCQLSEGEKTVSELQGMLGLSQSALSQHLAVLRRENVNDAWSRTISRSGFQIRSWGHELRR